MTRTLTPQRLIQEFLVCVCVWGGGGGGGGRNCIDDMYAECQKEVIIHRWERGGT